MSITNANKTESIAGQGYNVNIIRTQRKKTVGFKIENGELCLSVPKTLSKKSIQQLLAQKHQWIIEQLARVIAPSKQINSYSDGSVFLYLGKPYILQLKCAKKAAIELSEASLIVSCEQQNLPANISQQLTRWYKRQADKIIHQRVEYFEPIVGVQAGAVRIKAFKSRWGSCLNDGDLEFNWLLILAPEKVIDYVVVHELCHLIYFDHSPAFWQQVERVFPDYKEQKNWLKANGQTLVFG